MTGFQLLLGLHLVAVVIAAGSACWEIRTIVASGPVCGAMGLLLALLAYRRNLPRTLYYCLAPPTVAVACFAWIALFELSPDEAQTPVATAILLFSITYLPLARPVWIELREAALNPQPRLGCQFGMSTLLGLTLLVAIPLGFASSSTNIAIVAFCITYAFGVVGLLLKFHRDRTRERFAPPTDAATPSDAGVEDVSATTKSAPYSPSES